jgi:UDP-N-acetylglucosamine--N-acetylmuramyl-(pentapeptide) pyrophosphoryl-undecaprenol N-acetylglucosamine transferase
MNKKRIILTGGGTAGHIWPLLALAKHLKGEYDLLFLGSGKKEERELVEKEGIIYKKILSGKYRRYFSLMNFVDPFKVILGIIQAKYYIISFWPEVVVAKGGYVSLPAGLAAFILRRRLIIHESDAVLGLANRMLAPFSKKILTAFPSEYYPSKFHKKIVWTGVPIRDEIFTGDRKKALDDLDFETQLPTVLFIGGSSGAKAINWLALKSLKELAKICQVIIITGRAGFEEVRKNVTRLNSNQKKRIRYFDFVTRDLPDIFAASDIVVSRSGATTLFELAALAKPVIFIPYPFSAANHQVKNAQILEKNQAAIVYDGKDLTTEKLVDQIKRLLENRKALNNLSQNIKKFYKNDTDDLIMAEIKGSEKK